MEVYFKPIFIRDAQKLPRDVYDTVRFICFETFPKFKNPSDLYPYRVEKLGGFKDYYKIRLGDYRIGFKKEGDKIIFMRVKNRKDIYRYFP